MESLQFAYPERPGLVSIIMPTRNGERFIGETLASIGRQSYANWEVIVVEDGSQGATQAIVDAFAERFPNNRVHYQRNRQSCGAAYTRTVALGQAAGEFIALLDCDDIWLPDHLDTAVSALRTTGKDVAFSTVAMFEDGSGIVFGTWGPTGHDLATFPLSMFGRSFITPSALVTRRKVVAEVGPWNSNCRYCEDVYFLMRMIELGKSFQYVTGVHCLYRKNHAGATTQSIAGTIEEYTEVASGFINIPGLNRKSARRSVSRSYALAARLHAQNNPKADPSADRRRAAPVMFKAWQNRPKHVPHLLLTAWYAVRYGWKRSSKTPVHHQLPGHPAVIKFPPPSATPRRAAA